MVGDGEIEGMEMTYGDAVDLRTYEGNGVDGLAERERVVPVFEQDDRFLFHAVQQFAGFWSAEGAEVVFVRIGI